MMKGILTHGKVVTIDEEIAHIEHLVETGRVEQMITVAVERVDPVLLKVHVMPLGCPLPRAREALQTAIKAIDDMIGEAKP